MPIYSEDGKEYADEGMYAVGIAEPTEKGNIDLNDRPQVQTPEGVATVRSMSFERDGKEILIPTVAHDGSRILSNDEAIAQYDESGKHLGIYPDVATAEAYGERIHLDQEKMFSSPFEAAAARQKASVKPSEGRTEGTATKVMEAIPQAAIAAAGAVVTGPGKSMTPNPYKEGSEEFDFYERARRDNNFGWGVQMAVDMFGVGAATIPMREGLGTFGGMGALKSNWDTMDQAIEMGKAGKKPYEIFDATGWYRGHEGQWKFEIPDTKAKLTVSKLSDVGPNALLMDVLEHDELFKNYPGFENIKVKIENNPDRLGAYSEATNTLYLNENLDMKQVRPIILHELQHAIQSYEGFAKGAAASAPEQIRTGWEAELKDLKYIWENNDKFIAHMTKEELDQINQMYLKADALQDALQQEGSKLSVKNYMKTAGEVEARNVEYRSKLTDAERSLTPPSFTEDTNSWEQLVNFDVIQYKPYGKKGEGKPK